MTPPTPARTPRGPLLTARVLAAFGALASLAVSGSLLLGVIVLFLESRRGTLDLGDALGLGLAGPMMLIVGVILTIFGVFALYDALRGRKGSAAQRLALVATFFWVLYVASDLRSEPLGHLALGGLAASQYAAWALFARA